jgi:putative FmdB family regulatory protein
MPIYGYRCSQCGHELEVFQSMSAEPLRECPSCGGALRKLLYPVGVHFKGSGFYSTDYKNGGGSAGADKDRKGAKDGGESTSGSEGGSKPASGESSGTTGGSDKKAESSAAKE